MIVIYNRKTSIVQAISEYFWGREQSGEKKRAREKRERVRG
jgi:hypothetical protein